MLKDTLKDYRLKHCLSMKEMADKIGVTFLTYRRWENGYPCTFQSAKKICAALHIKKELIYDK